MRHFVAILFLSATALADPTTQPVERAIPKRPGYRLVDNYWAKPQMKIKLGDLVKVVDENGKHRLVSDINRQVEPLLRNSRTCVVEIDGNPFAWKLSSQGRVWNEDHTQGTQHLELIAAADEMKSDPHLALTRISIRPNNAIIQAVVDKNNQTQSVIVVITNAFIELAVTPAGQTAAEIILRAPSARLMLRDHPIETRNYLIPLLQLVACDPGVMQPAAGDVYRTFPDLPLEPFIDQTLAKLIPELSDPNPKVRNHASQELIMLGRRGVQAAMRANLSQFPPEAADRITAYIHDHTLDERPADQLLIDSNFLLDCLADPDPHVQKAAGECVQRLAKSSH